MLPVDDGAHEDSGIPAVSLSTSNPTPQVGEQVTLQCTVVSGESIGATYDFQPAGGRLMISRSTGVALLIVDESDVGTALTFTCTATNGHGTSRPSPQVVIVPTAAPVSDGASAPTDVFSSGTKRR